MARGPVAGFWLPSPGLRLQPDRAPTATLLDEVWAETWIEARRHPSFVHKLLNENYGPDEEPTKTMNQTGTWNVPVLLLSSDTGFAFDEGRTFPPCRLWLIEGHQRMDYLRARLRDPEPPLNESEVVS